VISFHFSQIKTGKKEHVGMYNGLRFSILLPAMALRAHITNHNEGEI
jgi:hypothetical protein